MSQLEEHFSNPAFFIDPKTGKTECTIQASGKFFDPEAFLGESSLSRTENLVTGRIGLPGEIRARIDRGELPYEGVFDIFDLPFLLIRISQAIEISLQFEDAILFLNNYFDDIKRLVNYSNVETVLMRFSIAGHDFAETYDPPTEFLELYQRLGIHGLIIG